MMITRFDVKYLLNNIHDYGINILKSILYFIINNYD